MNQFFKSMMMTTSLLAIGASAFAATELTRPVKVHEGNEINSYLGNQFGEVLYTFDLDQGPASACYGKCAEQWPPFLLSAEEAKSVTAPYGVITRTTGEVQLTLNGKPLYTYYLNRVEGDDKGDGIGKVWHDIDFK